MSSDITFITNEAGKTLRERFAALLGTDTRQFDCLVGYFFISGFYKLYPSLEKVEKVRILVGLSIDPTVWKLLREGKGPSEPSGGLPFHSHAEVEKQIPAAMLREPETAACTADVESGAIQFTQWIRSGKLEIKAHPSKDLHAKVYIMTFHDGDRDVGRVITGSSNLILSYITPNTLIRQARYADARRFLASFTILQLVNLGENVFERAVVPACFFFVRKGAPPRVDHMVTLKDVSRNSKFTGRFLGAASTRVLQISFSETPDNALTGELEPLGKSQAYLEDVIYFRDAGINYQRVKVGIGEKGKSDLGQRLLYEGERECCADVEFWKGEDVDAYFTATRTGRFVRVKEASQLRGNERVVLNREFFGTVPKLVWRQTPQHLVVAVDDRGLWFGRSVQAGVIRPSKCYLDYRFLCGILNSSYTRFRYGQLAGEGGRVFPQVKWAKIRRLSVPDAARDKQMPIINIVDKITVIKRGDRAADVTALEHEIDQLVYQLYRLTPEEIAIVEGAG